MTPERPHTSERRIGRRHDLIDHVIWEPQLRRRLFRRGHWEQATILEASESGALVQAHANRAIRQGTRISIALGADRGQVAVRRIEPAPNPLMSHYRVEFVWLDPNLRARFEWRGDGAFERPLRHDLISLR